MNQFEFCQGLNAAQQQAVLAKEQDMLVLAGAGSGKTRVLTARIAYLISHYDYSPHRILALTFTNKAALEMQARLAKTLGTPLRGMWVGTFHGICHRLLRRHEKEAGFEHGFQIIDADDQLRLLRRLFKQLNIDDKKLPHRQAQWFINQQKDAGKRAKDVKLSAKDQLGRQLLEVYRRYEETCRSAGLVDFAELLLAVFELFEQYPDILSHYQDRFCHILVDEFQDTNQIQYALLQQLLRKSAAASNYLTVIGDDDQSIYGWRGACVKNIQDFQKNHNDACLIRLEQNYRSSANILAAANAVIDENSDRIGKKLWTAEDDGEPLAIYRAFNETDEARFLVSEVKRLHDEKRISYKEIAILYRSNAQSRVLEEAFLQQGIAYRIYGGQRFFERAEIKDALAYLRLVARPEDDSAFERVVNTPARGIGDKTLQILRDQALLEGCSLWQVVERIAVQQLSIVPARASAALKLFYQLVSELIAACENSAQDLSYQVETMLTKTQLSDAYLKEGKERHQSRLENLSELVSAATEYMRYGEQDESLSPLQNFLSYSALESGELQASSVEDAVQLMTLHTAKGLEFPVVMLCGLEEGVFPHHLSIGDIKKLAEERRLCYVGLTRAMKKLYLSCSEVKRVHGRENYYRPSRFLEEIPNHLTEEVRFKSTVLRPQVTKPSLNTVYNGRHHYQSSPKPRSIPGGQTAGFQLGQPVQHRKFGKGKVIDIQGDVPKLRLKIEFQHYGIKWLLAEFVERVA